MTDEAMPMRLIESALSQALMHLDYAPPDESKRDSSMRIKTKWAVQNAIKALPELRQQWEDELLSDEAVKAARRANAEAWDEDFPDSGRGIIAQTLRAALATTKKGGE